MTDLELILVVRKTPAEKMSGFKAWQLRAARAAAGLSILNLAELSGVSVSSIQRAEKSGSDPMSRANQEALLKALAERGVVVSAPGEQPATISMLDVPAKGFADVEATTTGSGNES